MLQTEQVNDVQAIWKRELGLAKIRPSPAPPGSRNHHFVGYRQGEDRPFCFLKLMIRELGYRREVAASNVMASLGYRAQNLLGNGELENGLFWLAVPWLECEDVAMPTDEEVQEVARILGTLHRRTIGLDAPEMLKISLSGELIRQLNALQGISPEFHEQVKQRVDHLHRVAGEWETYEKTLPHCLLQGDFGWRNMVREKGGNLLLIDFEHSVIGPCWLEFAKQLDREFKEPQRLHLFMTEYRATIGPGVPDLADHYAWGMRLWQIAGIFVYTKKYGNETAFREYGLSMMEAFDRRWLFE